MNFISLDVETANPNLASICQIGLAVFRNGQVVNEFSSLVDPEDYFDPMNVHIHRIGEDTVRGAPTFAQISQQLNEFLADSICATHTAFDRSAIHQCCAKYSVQPPDCNWLDTARVARRTWEAVAHKGYGLANLAMMLGIEFKHHDALEDAKAAGHILCAAITESGIDPAQWLKKVNRRIGFYDSQASGFSAPIKQDGNPDGPLYGEMVVFTGALSIPRPLAAQKAAELGCAVNPGVTKKVTLLVVGDQDVTKLAGNQQSSKHRKALELIQQGFNIRILRESDFMAMIDA